MDGCGEPRPQPIEQVRRVSHSLVMEQPIVIDVHGGLEGRYVVEEQRADGAVVIRPDLSVASILARHGERALTEDEMPDWVRELPTDDEG